MRSIRLTTPAFILALLCAASLVARADDASRKAKAAELLTVSNSEQMMEQVLGSMQKMQVEQIAKMDLPPEVRASTAEMQKRTEALVRKMLSWEALKPRFVELYAATYTEPELDAIVGFYKSAAGQAMLNKMPQLMQGSMALTQEAVAGMMPEMMKIVEDMKQKK